MNTASINRHDVGVLQAGEEFDLGEEQPFEFSAHLGFGMGEDLQGGTAARVFLRIGTIDDPHRSTSDFSLDPPLADSFTDHLFRIFHNLKEYQRIVP